MGGDSHCVSPAMVHHSGKICDVGDGINGHMDTPCKLFHVMHSCHVHVCMCFINNFSCSVYPSVRHCFPSLLFTWGVVYGCAHAEDPLLKNEPLTLFTSTPMNICKARSHGGVAGPGPCMRPPPARPPPPPRVLRDSGLGTWRQRRPLFSAWRQRRPPFLV